jgi:solute:Na+ symporter, SSS family
LAAAMSSLDSSMHSMSTVCIRDFLGRLLKGVVEKRQVFLAQGLTIAFGVLGTSTALLLAIYPVKSLWDLFIGFVGLVTGGLSGLFLLGIFFKRANAKGALVGVILSSVIVVYIAKGTDVHFFLYTGVGLLSCVIIGYFFSVWDSWRSGSSAPCRNVDATDDVNEKISEQSSLSS